MSHIAVCNWGGTKFRAEFIKVTADEGYQMRALEKGPRFTVGTKIGVSPKEIVRWETGPPPELKKA